MHIQNHRITELYTSVYDVCVPVATGEQSQNHRTSQVGKDLKDHQVQPLP